MRIWPKLRSSGGYRSRAAVKPGFNWQNHFHGVELFDEYPQRLIGRPWQTFG